MKVLPDHGTLEIEGRIFDLAGEVVFELDADGLPKEYDPFEGKDPSGKERLHAHGVGPFGWFRVPGMQYAAGVYLIVIDGEVVYAGLAGNVRQRFESGYGRIYARMCQVGGPETSCRINHLMLAEARRGKHLVVFVHYCEDYAALEKSIRLNHAPRWNRC